MIETEKYFTIKLAYSSSLSIKAREKKNYQFNKIISIIGVKQKHSEMRTWE